MRNFSSRKFKFPIFPWHYVCSPYPANIYTQCHRNGYIFPQTFSTSQLRFILSYDKCFFTMHLYYVIMIMDANHYSFFISTCCSCYFIWIVARQCLNCFIPVNTKMCLVHNYSMNSIINVECELFLS